MLTQRTLGPVCAAEVTVDVTGLKEGDTAGLVLLQGKYSYAGIAVKDGKYFAVMNALGETKEEIPADTKITLRAECDFTDGKDEVRYFVNGNAIGEPFRMEFTLEHFTGARFALFVTSAVQEGGEAGFSDFVYERK